VYRELLERNPENTSYYGSLADALELHTPEERLSLLAEYRDKYPKSLAPARLYLNYAQGQSTSHDKSKLFVESEQNMITYLLEWPLVPSRMD
jgi:hypothetical protein